MKKDILTVLRESNPKSIITVLDGVIYEIPLGKIEEKESLTSGTCNPTFNHPITTETIKIKRN